MNTKFIEFKRWLLEFEKQKLQSKKLDYGCVMLYANIPTWNSHLEIIRKEDIYDDEFNDYGLELEPHCTVLFGIHLDENDPEKIKEHISQYKPIEVSIDTISSFKNTIYEVVKYDVPITPMLKRYHDELITTFPNTQSFPDYHPHMTISYVLPGKASKYEQKVKAFNVKFNQAVYSYQGRGGKEKIKIQLIG